MTDSRRQRCAPFGSDGRYFEWLYERVGGRSDCNPARSHLLLIEQLHRINFRWFIPNDDNRVEDGLELRKEFCFEAHIHGTQAFFEAPCSVLEMLIALAERADYADGEDNGVANWFSHMMQNLNLNRFTDARYDRMAAETIETIVERFMARTYNSDGHHGGLFPLRHAKIDQREVELWYQMSAYILERTDLDR